MNEDDRKKLEERKNKRLEPGQNKAAQNDNPSPLAPLPEGEGEEAEKGEVKNG